MDEELKAILMRFLMTSFDYRFKGEAMPEVMADRFLSDIKTTAQADLRAQVERLGCDLIEARNPGIDRDPKWMAERAKRLGTE